MDTDKHGWGKDFDANCTNSREGVRGGWGYLRTATGRDRPSKSEDGESRMEDGHSNAEFGTRSAEFLTTNEDKSLKLKSVKRPSAYAKATARQDENAKIKPN